MPVQQRSRQLLLHLNIHHAVVVSGCCDRRQDQQRIRCRGEATVPGRGPGHGRAIGIPIPQSGPVAHAEFIAVIQAGHSRQAVDQSVQQAIGAGISIQQRRQAPVDAPVEPVPLPLRQTHPDRLDHLIGDEMAVPQPEFIVIAQRQSPAGTIHRPFRLLQTCTELAGAATSYGREQMGGEDKVEGTMQLVLGEVGRCLFHGLDCLPEQQNLAAFPIHALTQTLQKCVGLRQPLTTGSLFFEQKRDGVEAEAINTTLQPEIDHLEHRLLHPGVGVVQVGLMPKKPVQVVLLRHRIPLPVGGFEMAEQNRSIAVAGWIVTPNEDLALLAALRRPSGPLKPRVQVACVIQHQIQNDPHVLAVGRRQKPVEGRQVSKVGVDPLEIRDVITAIP